MRNITPKGQLNGYQFIMEAYHDKALFRKRFMAIHFQLFLVAIMVLLSIRNSYRAIRALIIYPHRIASWCCIVMTFTGVASLITPMFFESPFGPECSTAALQIIVGLAISTAATNIILFERAYLAHQRNRWLLIIGLISIALPGPIYITAMWFLSTPHISDYVGCYTQNDYWIPYIRLTIDLPSNIIFSIAFFLVVYRRYTTYHEGVWKELGRDGIITMLLVIFSNMVCFIFNISNIFKEFGPMLYIADWLITSTLLVENQYRISTSTHTKKAEKSSVRFTTRGYVNSIESGMQTEISHFPSQLITKMI
ncbi:hypothetical protein BDF19DRAFT_245596 [Syncephalis fuscata]|nr:hypothetical protein BDF19DRAFT_245596 [Syncephalis fuscata]